MNNLPVQPPMKGGGSAPFVIAAVVMAAGILGIVLWKLSSSDGAPEPVTPVAAPSVEQESAAHAAAPPPPPPPEEAVDAGGEASAPAKPAAPSKPSQTACSGPCNGDVNPALRSDLRSRAMQARPCYERALRQNPQLQGRLVVGVRVGPAGQVCAASIASDQLGDANVNACVLQRFQASRFSRPTGGCVDAQVPVNFEAKP